MSKLQFSERLYSIALPVTILHQMFHICKSLFCTNHHYDNKEMKCRPGKKKTVDFYTSLRVIEMYYLNQNSVIVKNNVKLKHCLQISITYHSIVVLFLETIFFMDDNFLLNTSEGNGTSHFFILLLSFPHRLIIQKKRKKPTILTNSNTKVTYIWASIEDDCGRQWLRLFYGYRGSTVGHYLVHHVYWQRLQRGFYF